MDKDKQTFKEAIEEAARQLEELLKKRAEMDIEISKLRGTIISLSRLYPELTEEKFNELVKQPGLREVCLMVLRVAEKPKTPADIRDQLIVYGYNFSDLSSPLPAIHTTLKRLVESGEVESVEVRNKTAYKLKGQRRAG